MPLMINTNVASLNSQRQLLHSGNDLDQAMERLSSGKRVNTAADDAAGLAIANRMTSQITGLNQSIRNANDGISLIQTAEGALDESTNVLQRMRELAIQAANGIYSDADRSTLDAEVQQLKAELDRIADTTTFNGQPLLDGTLSNVTLQVGSEEGDTIDLSVAAFDPSSLGGASGDIVGRATTGLAALTALAGGDELSVNDVTISALDSATTVNQALAIINSDLDNKGAEASTLVSVVADSVGDGFLIGGTDSVTIDVVDGDGNTQSFVLSDTDSLDSLVDKINSETSVDAQINSDGKLVLSAVNAEDITVTDSTTGDSASGLDGATNFSLVFTDTSADKNGVKIENAGAATPGEIEALGINVSDDDGNIVGSAVDAAGAGTNLDEGDLIINGVEIGAIQFDTDGPTTAAAAVNEINKKSADTGVVAYISAGAVIEFRSTTGDEIVVEARGDDSTIADNILANTGLMLRNAASGGGSIASVQIATAAGAQRSLDIIDVALEQINAVRADLGAVNNRLDFTISNLANVVENTEASRSRIMDADFASETAALSRAQVLQQASQAILAQANARPQQVLQLLQG